jgi:hypothetical protein
MFYCVKTICIVTIFLLYNLFWRLSIRGDSQNKGYIKNQYIPRLIEERVAYIPRLAEEYMDTWPGRGG